MKKNDVPSSSAKFKVYDFRMPKSISKDELNNLSIVTDAFSRNMETCISGLTREICSVYNPKITEVNFGDYLNNLPNHTILGVFTLNIENSDLPNTEIMLNFPSNLFFILLDILLGGVGKPLELERQHTDIEIAIYRYLMLKFQDVLNDSWASTAKATFTFDKTEISAKNVEVKSSNEVKLIMNFDVNIKNELGSISIVYSSRFIEDFLSRLIVKNNTEAVESHDSEKDAQRRKDIMSSISDAELEITSVLSEISLNMHDILSLSVGDVIPLDKKISEDVEIQVENIPWFYGKLGNGNIKKAVKITKIIDDDNLD